MSAETGHVAVSLRGGDGNRFLSDFEISTVAGQVEPIEYQGRRYVFSRRVNGGGYTSAGQPDLYVFVEEPRAESA